MSTSGAHHVFIRLADGVAAMRQRHNNITKDTAGRVGGVRVMEGERGGKSGEVVEKRMGRE